MKKTTGLASRIALFSRPLKSAALDGITTFSPGACTNIASRLWLCCPPTPQPAPVCASTTIGNSN
ncbi:MAG: hypothetical protein QM722_23675 [Piscinibacter sp.]